MRVTEMLKRQDLLSLFKKQGAAQEQVGLEVEVGTVNPSTGLSVPYEGARGVKALLLALAKEFEGVPDIEGGNIIGVRLSDGGNISIEHHGAMEFSSPPFINLGQAFSRTREFLHECAGIAETLDIALLTGGNLPFNTFDNTNWMPLLRGPFMRNYLTALGEEGSLGKHIMGFALATQTTLDYLNENDLIQKLQMLVAISPIAAALFVNSPIEFGRVSGVLSRRMQYWERFDPARCGLIPLALSEDMTLDGFIDWSLTKPMMFRKTHNGCELASKRPFSSLLKHGFCDGSFPVMADWVSHLSQILTDVRLRNTIEMRIVDGQTIANIGAVAAFWVGITYHPPSCHSAWNLMKGQSLEAHQQARRGVAIRGLHAMYNDEPIYELARELVRLAKCGLEARIEAGLEPSYVLGLLEPVEEVIHSRITFAERCLMRWQSDLQMNSAKYVNAFRVQVT